MITIPEPCSEDWGKMRCLDVEHRYCEVCNRTLTDFTRMSDDELLLFFKHNNKNLCGRFLPEQLNRPLIPLPDDASRAVWWKAALLLPLTFFAKNSSAQLDSSIPVTDSSRIVQNDTVTIDTIQSAISSADSVPESNDSLKSAAEPANSDTVKMPATGEPCKQEIIVVSMGCVSTDPGFVLGGFGTPQFEPTWYEPHFLSWFYAPFPKSNPQVQQAISNSITERGPHKPVEKPPVAPEPHRPWFQAILPSILRIRRKN